MKRLEKLLLFTAIVFCFVVTLTASVQGACAHNWQSMGKEGIPCVGYQETLYCNLCDSIKYDNVGPSQDHTWKQLSVEHATCTEDGFVHYYCTACQVFKDETLKATGHSYTYIYNNDATCTQDGTKVATCKNCSERRILTDKGSAKGHEYDGIWVVKVEATCIEKGVSMQHCKRCGIGNVRDDGYGSHKDKDGNYMCDFCSADLSPQPDNKEPDNNNNGDVNDSGNANEDNVIKNCSCKCHKGGITGFFWKIGNFFAKLFKIKSKQICACGIYHF
jgi:hypothetical protein